MARMNSKVRREYDAAADVVLRASGGAAVVGDTPFAPTSIAGGVCPLNTLVDAYWDNDEVPQGIICVNVHVTAVTLPDSPGSTDIASLYVDVDTVENMASPVEVARLFDIRTAGFYALYVDSHNVELLEPGAKYIRMRSVITDADDDASINFHAWMTFKGV